MLRPSQQAPILTYNKGSRPAPSPAATSAGPTLTPSPAPHPFPACQALQVRVNRQPGC